MKVAFVALATLAAAAVASPLVEREDNESAPPKLYFPEDDETCVMNRDVFVCHAGKDDDATVYDESADNSTIAERSSVNDPTIVARFCPGCPTRCDALGYCKSSCKGTWGVCKCSKKKKWLFFC